MSATSPPNVAFRARDTHRLIPSKYSPRSESVLVRLSEDDDDLAALFELESATNDRLIAHAGLLPGIGAHELVFGVPYASIVNAAFCHAHPLGSRFNGPERGAWYAGLSLGTAQREVAFHKATEYAEIGRFDDSVTYDDYLCDVGAELHDLRDPAAWTSVLDPDSYVESQALATELLNAGSLGLVYPSVRDRRGTCVALFQPALVANVRKAKTWRFTWSGAAQPSLSEERPSPGR